MGASCKKIFDTIPERSGEVPGTARKIQTSDRERETIKKLTLYIN